MRTRIAFLAVALAMLVSSTAKAQGPTHKTSADIFHAIEKLNVLGSALYVAAHPDDENTRLISYLANDLKVNTTYLSMTRGDGGQNLVGPEMRELLGVIRTQELLMARATDGGNQMFTRANDFGYSKTPQETLEFWNKSEVMADVVWAIRKTRPDVIINRFPHEHLNGNHGHHTTSAMLSFEAFELAGDPEAFPEQLAYVEPWKPTRLYFNTGWWFFGSRENFEKADKSNMAAVDVGVYYPAHGLSNTEIAAQSRSMHKSQGFGSSGTRSSSMEYVQLLKGESPGDKNNIFDGINVSWSRIGAGHITNSLTTIRNNFDHEDPSASIPALVALHGEISALDPSYWQEKKLAELEEIIIDCAGMYVSIYSDEYTAAAGGQVDVSLEVTNRSDAEVTLLFAEFSGTNLVHEPQTCPRNQPVFVSSRVQIPAEIGYSTPYWLDTPGSAGMYRVDDQLKRGLPDNISDAGALLRLEIEGLELSVFRPLVHKHTDPVAGEVFEPFEIVPAVYVNFDRDVLVFASTERRAIQLTVRTETDNFKGTVEFQQSNGWSIEPSQVDVNLERKGDEETHTVYIVPPDDESVVEISAVVRTGNKDYSHSLFEIDYDHIPRQLVLEPAVIRAVRIGLEKAGNRVAYIMGAGDEIPESLEQVGYSVDVLDEEHIDLETLGLYDAVILGVRLYNVSGRVRYYQDDLFEYVKQGGTLITQYNTTRRRQTESVSPLELELSRERVTDETATVTILQNDHPALNFPNKITSADFENWVQERGLYFPIEWDYRFTPLLSMHDDNEEALEGSLLVAPYGEGYFVYTGLSWFRQLPAGVPGAYRLFTNLISLGKSSKS